MAKLSITEVSANNTFQVWLDKTNELVNLVQNDILTASLSSANGDITVGNVTLEGNFAANTVIVNDLLRTNTLSPKAGFTEIEFTSPTKVSTNQVVLTRLSSAVGSRLSFFNTTDTDWQIGFENNVAKKFVITNGAGVLRLDDSGNLEISGTFSGTAANATAVTVISTSTTDAIHYPVFVDAVSGIEQIRTDNGYTYNPSTGILTAVGFVGNVTGNVTGNAGSVTNGVYTTGNQTISGTKTFSSTITGSITGNAGTVTDGVYLSGSQTITGAKTFSSNIVSTAAVSSAFTSQDTVNAPFFGAVSHSGSSYAPIVKLRATGTSNITTGSIGILHNVDNSQEVAIHLIQGGGTNSRIWRFTQNGDFTSPGDVTAFSDERLKTNIKTIENPLEKVLALRGVSFEKDGRSSIGVIAQEVEKVIPEVVHEGDYKSVAYGNMIGLLVEAIKELKREVEVLKGNL